MPLYKNVKFWHWCVMIHRIYAQPFLNRRHFCILLCQLCSHEQLPLATGLRAFWFTGSKLFFLPPYIPTPNCREEKRREEKRREEKRREEKRREEKRREEKRREENHSMPVTMGMLCAVVQYVARGVSRFFPGNFQMDPNQTWVHSRHLIL